MSRSKVNVLLAILLIALMAVPPLTALASPLPNNAPSPNSIDDAVNQIISKYNAAGAKELKNGATIKLPKPVNLMLPKKAPGIEPIASVALNWNKLFLSEEVPKIPVKLGGQMRIPLITGDIVIVHTTIDGKIDSVSIAGQNGKPANYVYYQAIIDGRLYLFPKGVNLKKLDPELFDISYLASYGYTIENKLDSIPVIVKYNDNVKDLGLLVSSLQGLNAKVTHEFDKLDLVSARVPLNEARAFLKYVVNSDMIEKVYLDYKVTASLLQSVPMIGAPQVWSEGYNGSGVKIAILDTGIDKTHPMLQGKVVLEKSFVEYPDWEVNDTMDYFGHGTHVASTAAGKIWYVDVPVVGGTRVLINQTFDTPTFDAIQVFLDDYEENDIIYYAYNFTLVLSSNGSLVTVSGESDQVVGYPLNETYSYDLDGDNVTDLFASVYIWAYSSDDDTLGAIVKAHDATTGNWTVLVGYDHLGPGVAPGASLWNLKVLNSYGWGYTSWIINAIMFAALGPDGTPNTGDEANVISMSLGAAVPSDGTDPLSLAVDYASSLGVVSAIAAGNAGPGYRTVEIPGAAKTAITVGAATKDYRMAWFSSQGPTVDMRIKPTVVAPGVDITAALPGNSYASWSGTSMATPHVSGSAALLIQAYKQKYNMTLTPQQIKDLLVMTAMPLGYDPLVEGAGLVQVNKAADATILVDPAIDNFMLSLNESLNLSLSIENLEPVNKTVTINGIIYDFLTKAVVYNFTGSVTLGADETKPVQFTIPSTAFPAKGYYIAELYFVDGHSNKIYKGLYSISILNKLQVNLTYADGTPGSWETVIIFKKSYSTLTEAQLFSFMGYSDDNGTVSLYVNDGEYFILWIVDLSDEPTYVVKEVNVTSDTSVVLNSSDTQPLVYDAGMAASYWEDFYLLGWNDPYFSVVVGFIRYLGGATDNPVVYVSPTELMSQWRAKFVPEGYDVANSTYFYDMAILINKTQTPMTVTPDYDNAGYRITDYGTDGSPYWDSYVAQHVFLLDSFAPISISYFLPIDAPIRRIEVFTGNSIVSEFYIEWSKFIAFVDDFDKLIEPGDLVYWGYGLLPMQAPHVIDYSMYGLPGVIYTDLGMDALGNQLWFDYGHLTVWFNGTVIYDSDVDDFDVFTIPQTNGTLEISVFDYTYLDLSTYVDSDVVYKVVNGELYGLHRYLVLFQQDVLGGEILCDSTLNITGIVMVLDTSFSPVNASSLDVTITDHLGQDANVYLSQVDTGVYMFIAYLPSFNSIGPVDFTVEGSQGPVAYREETAYSAFNVSLLAVTVGPPGSGADYTSLSDAVAQASPYTVIMVFPGVYNDTGVVIDKPLWITGIDPENPPVINTTSAFVVSNTKDVILENMQIGTIMGGDSVPIGVEAANSTSQATAAIEIVNTTDAYLANLTVNAAPVDAISVSQSTVYMENVTAGNAASGAGLHAVASDVYVWNSMFHDSYWGILAADSSITAYNTAATNNAAEGITLIGGSTMSAAYVTATGNDVGIAVRGSSHADVYYFYAAGNTYFGLLTADSGTLYAKYGTVAGSLTGIGLFNTDPSATSVIEDVSVMDTGVYGVFTALESSLQLTNATIENAGNVAILAIENSMMQLTNVMVNGTSWIGLGAYGNSKVNAMYLAVYNTPWEAVLAAENSSVAIEYYHAKNIGRGLGLIGNAKVSLSEAYIEEPLYEGIIVTAQTTLDAYMVRIEAPGITGIHGYDNANITASYVTIENPAWAGVALFQSSTGSFNYLLVENSTGSGVILLDNAVGSFTNSTILSSTWGVSVWGNSIAYLDRVLIENSTWEGIAAFENTQVYADSSTLYHNRRGISVFGYATVYFNNGWIEGNSDWGAGVWDFGYIDAGSNYWGDPSGPYDPVLNPSGSGDALAGNTSMINYSPWLTSPPSGAPTPI
ncbi:MAG: S8 family serine peptidase [Desulfurococcales archaeon]|nr:S8 family serine peptidase [Desulfurococcales archaeon]